MNIRTLLTIAITFALFVHNPAGPLAAEAKLVVGTGHTMSVHAVAYSPDGRFALSGSFGGVLKLWEIDSGRELRTFPPISGLLQSVAFSPDGRFALTASDAVEMWDISTGERVRIFSKIYPPNVVGVSYTSATFSPDGSQVIASQTFEEVDVWNTETGERIHLLKSAPGKKARDPYHVMCASLSSDGRHAASGGSDDEVKLWDAVGGQLLHRLGGHSEGVWSLAFSADGRFLLSGGKKKIKLWEVGTGKLLRTFRESQDFVTSLSFSPDGQHALSTDRRGEMVYWDVSSGKKLHVYEPREKGVRKWGAAAFSPDGKYALHSRQNVIKLWDLATHAPIRELKGYSSGINALLFPPDRGGLVMSAQSDGTLKYWDLSSGREVDSSRVDDRIVGDVSYSADGKTLFYFGSGDKAVVADAGSGKTLRSFRNGDGVFQPAFSPDGAMVLTMNQASGIFWDARTGKKRLTMTDDQFLRIAAFSPDSRFALIGGESDIKIWDAATGRHVRDLEIKPSGRAFRAIAVSADGRLVLAGALFDPRVFLWDFASGKLLRVFTGHRQGVVAVAFSPDGSRALSSGYDESAVKLWDVSSGQLLETFTTHSRYAGSVAFSADGKYAVSGGSDGMVKIYDVARRRELGSRTHISDTDWVVSTEDGRFDGSAEGIRRLHFVRGLETYPLEAFYEKFYTPNLLALLRSEEPDEMAVPIDIGLEMSTPPLVEILFPGEGEPVSSENLTIQARVTDQGSGIDEIRLYQNGKLVNETARGIRVEEKTTVKATHRFDAILVPGRNDFKLIALSRNRTESKPALLSINFTSQAATVTPSLYLLSIGINSYKNSIYNLNYGRPDAESFSAAIVENAKGIFPEIITKEIYDEQAVKPEIEREITRLISQVGSEDVFVFYYAGHGVMAGETEGEGDDFFLVLHDVTQLYGRDEHIREKAISAAQLKEWFRKIPAQKQLIILDACQAGGAVQTFARRGAAEQKAIAQLARSTGTAIIASAGTQQFASEFQKLGHGLFTYALLQALSGKADGGDPRDGKITVKEIEAYLGDRVPALSEQYHGAAQYPNSYAVGNDFPLTVTRPAAR